MASLIDDEVLQSIRALQQTALALLDSLVPGQLPTAEAWQHLARYDELFEELEMPIETQERGLLHLHSCRISIDLYRLRPVACYPELRALCYVDIPLLEQDYVRECLGLSRPYNWDNLHPAISRAARPWFEAGDYAATAGAVMQELGRQLYLLYPSAELEDAARLGDELHRQLQAAPAPLAEQAARFADLSLAEQLRRLRADAIHRMARSMRRILQPDLCRPGSVDFATIGKDETWGLVVFSSHETMRWAQYAPDWPKPAN